jgi:hypothetical protein
VVLLVATGSAAVAAANSDGPLPPATQKIVTPALVEAPECWALRPGTPSTYPGANVETITLTIEPTSLLAVDAQGRVTAAETNTGCAPRPGDHLYLVHPDGNLTEATGLDVTRLHFTGDFTLFGYHSIVG